MKIATGIAGLQVIGLLHEPAETRVGARGRIRLALRELVASTLQIDVARVAIESLPGHAPVLLVDGAPVPAGISLAHDGWISVAAYHAQGAVGIDVMQVQVTSDWYDVARDYLGPAALALLAATSDELRATAFARAWTAREASLKCWGRGLIEWSEPSDRCRLATISVAQGYVATVAV